MLYNVLTTKSFLNISNPTNDTAKRKRNTWFHTFQKHKPFMTECTNCQFEVFTSFLHSQICSHRQQYTHVQ